MLKTKSYFCQFQPVKVQSENIQIVLPSKGGILNLLATFTKYVENFFKTNIVEHNIFSTSSNRQYLIDVLFSIIMDIILDTKILFYIFITIALFGLSLSPLA